MSKPTYEQLEARVQELEKLTGELIDNSLNAEQHELFDLSVLCNISQVLASSSTMDLDELLADVIDEVNRALLSEGAGVLLYDDHRGDLYWRQIRYSGMTPEVPLDELRIPLDHSIAGEAFRHNEPVRVNDASQDPRYYPSLSKKIALNIRSLLHVPLNAKNKTVGVITAMNKIGGDFSEHDEALLVSLSSSIALAVENATMYERLKKYSNDLEMIYRSTMAIASTMDLDHLFQVVLGELKTAMGTEAAAVLLYDEHQGDLYWHAVQDDQRTLLRRIADLRLPLEASVSGQVFITGEPALLNDPHSSSVFFKPFEERTGFKIRNEVLVPLHTRETTIGVLVVMNKREGQFTQDDVHLLSSLAGVVALSTENAFFFEELMKSYRELEDINRVKTKILNHLSHELRTPLAIIRGTAVIMQRKLEEAGMTTFDRPLARMNRHLQSLNRLEEQVESIMMTGYSWEKRYITLFLQAVLDLMEVQAEYTPEIKRAVEIMYQWMEKTFPTRRDTPERINVKNFGKKVFDACKAKAEGVGRELTFDFDLQNNAELFIPDHVLQAVMEGLIRNAIEATPQQGSIRVGGKVKGDRYIFTVKDSGIGIPDKDKELIFGGFYPIQETDTYSTGGQYSFNAGGKGIDLLRIRMFSELYGFRLSFSSRRCPHLNATGDNAPGDINQCRFITSGEECEEHSGSEFVVDFPLADSKTAVELLSEDRCLPILTRSLNYSNS